MTGVVQAPCLPGTDQPAINQTQLTMPANSDEKSPDIVSHLKTVLRQCFHRLGLEGLVLVLALTVLAPSLLINNDVRVTKRCLILWCFDDASQVTAVCKNPASALPKLTLLAGL